MRKVTLALLAAASTFAATSANAAIYLQYTFGASGNGERLYYDGAEVKREAFASVSTTYIIALTGPESKYLNGADGSGYPGYDNFSKFTSTLAGIQGFGGGTGINAQNGLSFGSFVEQDRGLTSSINGFPCGYTGGEFSASFILTKGCASKLSMTLTGYRSLDRFEGAITSVEATLFEGSSETGVTSISFSPAAVVPEPATWAMMLLGFCMVASAVRIRRSSAKITFA